MHSAFSHHYIATGREAAPEGVSTLGNAQSFFGLTSKIPPLASMLNFDADVKKATARHQCENHLTLAV